MAEEQLSTLAPLKIHAETFIVQLRDALEETPPKLTFIEQRLVAAKEYFSKIFQSVLIQTRTHKNNVVAQSKTKTYQEELADLESIVLEYLLSFEKSVVLLQGILEGKEITKNDFKVNHSEGGIFEALLQHKTQIIGVESMKKGEKRKGEPYLVTHEMYLEGKSPQEIARERDLSESTILFHFSILVQQGKVDARALMDLERLDKISEAFKGFNGNSLMPIKDLLGDSYTYGEIRLVKAHLEIN